MVLSFTAMEALEAIHNHLPANSMYHIDIGIKLYIWYINTIYVQYTWNIQFLSLKKRCGPSFDYNRIAFTSAYFVPNLVQIVYLAKTLLYEYRIILVNYDRKRLTFIWRKVIEIARLLLVFLRTNIVQRIETLCNFELYQ